MRRKLILFSLGVVTAIGFVGCASSDADQDSHRRTTGQYIDDKVLVQKVKSALGDSPVYKFPDVKVNTYNGVVQLTGFVESEEQKRRAEEIARNVRDVASVQNQITLKSDTERVRDTDADRNTIPSNSTTNRTTTTTRP
jgi:hyperosmotically inducible protein